MASIEALHADTRAPRSDPTLAALAKLAATGEDEVRDHIVAFFEQPHQRATFKAFVGHRQATRRPRRPHDKRRMLAALAPFVQRHAVAPLTD